MDLMEKGACWHLLELWYLRNLQDDDAMYLEQLKASVGEVYKILTHQSG